MGKKKVNKKRQKGKQKLPENKLLEGVLEITRSGIGYVSVEGLDTDIMIRPGNLHTALHGDKVGILRSEIFSKGRRLYGVVHKVLQRKRTEFIGRIQINTSGPASQAATHLTHTLNQRFAFFTAEVDRPMPDIYIPPDKINGAKDNDRVVVRFLSWDDSDKIPVGEVISILEKESGNDAAMKGILLEENFPLYFSDEALEQAARIPDTISHDELNRRKDYRHILTFTIDPADAKDFDDAISFRILKNGNFEVGIHIADVSHYLEPDTPLDKEAYQRATSVYLPDRVNPMLPEHLSNYLCSLRPHEDKLTFSAIFRLNAKAEVKNYWLGKAIIRSNHRFTYEEVQAIIEEKAGLYVHEILLLNELAQKMRKRRIQNGAFNFSSQDIKFKLNEKGEPIGIMIKESREAHQLIEELMLLANRTVAETIAKISLKDNPLPFPYRIHDLPDEEKLLPFARFVKKFGYKFDTSSPQTIAKSFNQLLNDVKGKPEQHVLEQLGIRTMAKAKYSSENRGHYGLGFKYYCHFTSPIRRYPDVMVHRILYDVLNNEAKPDKKLEEKCVHCSERERAAMECERAANKYMQIVYMKNYLGEEFEGVISGVASFGFWVETLAHKCEGLVSINSLLEYDDFYLAEDEFCLIGRRTGKKFRIGDKIWIKVVAAHITRRQLDYEWVVAGSDFSFSKKLTKKQKKSK